MREKLISILALVFAQISSVAGQGHRQAINQTLNPSGTHQVLVLYETVGWYLAGVLTVLLLGVLAYGWKLGEWRRENYWLLLILCNILGIAVVVLFPFALNLF